MLSSVLINEVVIYPVVSTLAKKRFTLSSGAFCANSYNTRWIGVILEICKM